MTNCGELVAFACLWHEEHARLMTFLCVHPAYRQRGIATLLLRMIEVRAREHVRQANPRQRVVLQGLFNSTNAGAQRLFEREGYQSGRPFLRISFVLPGEPARQDQPAAPHLYTVDVGLEPHNSLYAAHAPTEQEVLYHIQFYHIYEKELRPAACEAVRNQTALQAIGT